MCDGDVPAGCTGRIYAWNGYAEPGAVRSLLRYVETHGERLRRTYLVFIHDLGEAEIAGKRLVEHLDLGGGFSFWWTTRLAEKSIFKSPRIIDCLRLLALDEIVAGEACSRLTLVSGDRILARAVEGLCRNQQIPFEWRRCPASARQHPLRRVHDALPHVCQGAIQWLRHAIGRWPLRRAAAPAWHGGDQAVTFISYFFALDGAAAARGEFYQHQWETLPGVLGRAGIRTNWLHHFLYGPEVPDTQRAVDLIRRFNVEGDRLAAHALVDAGLTLRVLLSVLARWVAFLAVAFRLRAIRTRFTPPGSTVSLWPLLRDDWYSSMVGTAAIVHLMLLALFDRALRGLPRQTLGLYLCENQGWERALIAMWRKHGHGRLIAVQHSTVRFWDLRYADDPRTIDSRGRFTIPLPDQVAVNGRVARRQFADSGYSDDRLAEVEALRYLHLSTPRSRPADAGTPIRRVLILGDFRADATTRMLQCAGEASRLVARPLSFVLRCHPARPVDPGPWREIVEVSDRPLPELMAACDAVFSSNTTSAGLDAYLSGVPVIVFLNDDSLNVSPLRGFDGVPFASDGPQLAAALGKVRRATAQDAADFFWVDPELPRWRRLFADVEITAG